MAVHLPPHKHCLNCEGPIPESKDYCSEECMIRHKVKEKSGSRKMKLFYVVAAVALVAIWVLSFVKL
jgi:predicted nucleic acid-binding Zn ribbon protein